MDIWFTSDTHYGHANVIEYCKRPFKDVQEMNEALIENFNSLVKPEDEVYHLGDFSFSRDPYRVASRLNGRIHLILGNHDNKRAMRDCKFVWVKDVYLLRDGKDKFWLSHYAHLRWPKSHHGTYHLFGHSHGNLQGYGRSMDVGVDCTDYKPIHIDDVVYKLKAKDPTPHHDD
jgi:calcineurin-like phosphoesterase family protein